MGAFLTQNVVDVFRVLRTALRVAILCEVNCHTSFERTSHNGLKTLTLILLKALMRTNEEQLEENISKQLRLRIAVESNTNESEPPPTFAGEPKKHANKNQNPSAPHDKRSSPKG